MQILGRQGSLHDKKIGAPVTKRQDKTKTGKKGDEIAAHGIGTRYGVLPEMGKGRIGQGGLHLVPAIKFCQAHDADRQETKDDEEKNQMLIDLLRKEEFKKVLIFSETKRQVSKLCRLLKKFEVKVDEIHGDKSQQYRSKAIQKFKSGSIQVMVATDVASRGIDIDNISHVINYRVPSSKESYIHRIGRTGRAGKEGYAITFI